MTSAVHAHGTQIKKGATAIVEVLRISGPNMKQDTIDCTNMDSTSKWREYIGGLRDGGDIRCEGNYLPAAASHAAVFTDLTDGSEDVYALVWSDSGSTTCTATCIITDMSPSAAHDGKLTWSFGLKVSGAPAIA